MRFEQRSVRKTWPRTQARSIIHSPPTTQRQPLILTLPAVQKRNFRLMSSVRPILLEHVLVISEFVRKSEDSAAERVKTQPPKRVKRIFLPFSGRIASNNVDNTSSTYFDWCLWIRLNYVPQKNMNLSDFRCHCMKPTSWQVIKKIQQCFRFEKQRKLRKQQYWNCCSSVISLAFLCTKVKNWASTILVRRKMVQERRKSAVYLARYAF